MITQFQLIKIIIIISSSSSSSSSSNSSSSSSSSTICFRIHNYKVTYRCSFESIQPYKYAFHERIDLRCFNQKRAERWGHSVGVPIVSDDNGRFHILSFDS